MNQPIQNSPDKPKMNHIIRAIKSPEQVNTDLAFQLLMALGYSKHGAVWFILRNSGFHGRRIKITINAAYFDVIIDRGLFHLEFGKVDSIASYDRKWFVDSDGDGWPTLNEFLKQIETAIEKTQPIWEQLI